MTTPVNTASVKDRRQLRFETIDDCLTDADRLVAADRLGKLRLVGNWSLGTILNHVAAWVEFAYSGSPVKAPWFVVALSRVMKRRFLYKGLGAGVRIPRVEGGTVAREPATVEQALPRFKAAFERLRREPPTKPNELFGQLTHAEWIALQLRHAELHMSFAVPL
jgi:hypothetical protein